MDKRITGAVFCAIAAFLYAIRYVCAAIYLSGANWGELGHDVFLQFLGYIGYIPLVLSIIALIAGLYYLITAERTKKS